ncbi:MAG: hypothetical protein KH274_01640 [Veillonella sp. oral taxon 780]|uniref:hypothetical protein n=1 Tax=Veillonella sp. CNR 79/14 TaxID=2490954 RepID=UPI000F8EC7DE|nr:hypothetical protein [Veillonella sp. CNR 79/14]MBS6626157.1 hypothetical protein [Veillonella sp. oral taxon 780]
MGKGPIFALLGIFVCAASIGSYYVHHQPVSLQGPRIGVVRLQEVVEKHPNFHSYDEQKKELLRLEAQRDREDELLKSKLGTEVGKSEEHLKQLESNLTESLNQELQTKIALREAELNQELAAKQRELIEQYRKNYKVEPSEADIEIVNLQLWLTTEMKVKPIDEEQRKRWDTLKAEKEQRLSDLLAQRSHRINGSQQWKDLEAKVAEAMVPAQTEAQQKLSAYATEQAKALGAQRDQSMKGLVDSQQEVLAKVHREGTTLWDAEWEQRLAQKRDEVQALHDAILEDIRVRAGVLARAKQLDLVLVDHITDRTGMDLTEEIIQSYGQ